MRKSTILVIKFVDLFPFSQYNRTFCARQGERMVKKRANVLQKGVTLRSRRLLFCYCCPVNSTGGAKDHRRGCEPPGQDSLTIVSPEGATEYVICLITTCLCLCRPFGAFSFVATLPGVVTPVCGLSSLRDFWQASMSCYSSETPMREDLKGRERNFPRTAIKLNTEASR